MSIHRLNHAVLYVRNVERSVAFYRDVLGFRVARAGAAPPPSCRPPGRPTTTTSACSRSGPRGGDHRPGAAAVGLYHLAWEVDTLAT